MTLLRPSTQQSRTAPVTNGVCRLIANHHDLAIFESAPEVRVLCSAGITRPQRSYDPVRPPSWPPPIATLRPLPSPVTGLPRLPEPPFRRAVPTTPADQTGARVDCFPAHTAFPKWQEGRHPHCHFRGLLRLHSRYGPPDRSAAQRRPLSRGSSPAGCPAEPLVSYQINRQLSGWILPPLMIRAFGAHCHLSTYAPQQTRSYCSIRRMIQHSSLDGMTPDQAYFANLPLRGMRSASASTAS